MSVCSVLIMARICGVDLATQASVGLPGCLLAANGINVQCYYIDGDRTCKSHWCRDVTPPKRRLPRISFKTRSDSKVERQPVLANSAKTTTFPDIMMHPDPLPVSRRHWRALFETLSASTHPDLTQLKMCLGEVRVATKQLNLISSFSGNWSILLNFVAIT